LRRITKRKLATVEEGHVSEAVDTAKRRKSRGDIGLGSGICALPPV
jgi:hypothetical protein